MESLLSTPDDAIIAQGGRTGSAWAFLWFMMLLPAVYIPSSLLIRTHVLPVLAPYRFSESNLSEEQVDLWGEFLFEGSYDVVGIAAGLLW